MQLQNDYQRACGCEVYFVLFLEEWMQLKLTSSSCWHLLDEVVKNVNFVRQLAQLVYSHN